MGIAKTRPMAAKIDILRLDLLVLLVPKMGFEPTRPCEHYALNVARLPFRHFGLK